ncbi:hypothetical protein B0H13DRAFT_2377698 [Mycena leptocephala]|nr:hypothetical protein B0H13DRAFT_2377698 [Mycena leptocephala]
MARGRGRGKSTPSRTGTRRSTRFQRQPSLERDASGEREGSPPWVGMNSSQLPDDSTSIHSDYESELQEDIEKQNDTQPPELSDEEDEELSQAHAMNARSPRWVSWQDRYLAQAVDQIRPFLLPPSEREEGWNRTAEVLHQDSSAVGERSTVDRSGSACKTRFMRIMREHRKGETESRMKTGAVEEVSEHIKIMTELQAIMNDHQVSTKESSAKSKHKADIEDQAGKELCDAAMKGLARSEGLIDVSELGGASVREKQGQRKRARPPLASSSHHNRASKESNSDVGPPSKRRRGNVLRGVLEQRNKEDTKRLNDARARADQHHSELLQAQNATLGCLKDLTSEIRGLREDNHPLAIQESLRAPRRSSPNSSPRNFDAYPIEKFLKNSFV